MERRTTLKEAKDLFRENFIGLEELKRCSLQTGIRIPETVPEIPFSIADLINKSADHLLILGATHMNNGESLTLSALRNHFGYDPDRFEPCFYNQDWYLKEKFMHRQLERKWYLLKKSVVEESRSINPDILLKKYLFPSAILCAFTFFTCWFLLDKRLWEHDFLWCDDVDHNGDRIYVGKYHDIDGINKNGFSIHRHLKLSSHYGCIELN